MTTSVLAAFASRHSNVAAGLIVLSEFCNVAIGFMIGSSLLANQPSWYLSLLLGGLVFVRMQFHRYSSIQLLDLTSVSRFRFQKTSYFLLFLFNFLAYTIAGGICGRSVIHPEPSVSVASESSITYSERIEKDSLSQQPQNQLRSQASSQSVPEKPGTGTRIGYFFLFLGGVVLAGFSSSLACRLACANKGFLTVMVILLGVGILAGGFYFLGRALDKNMKLYKDMTKAERKREGRRYGRTVLGTLAGLLLSFLAAAISN